VLLFLHSLELTPTVTELGPADDEARKKYVMQAGRRIGLRAAKI